MIHPVTFAVIMNLCLISSSNVAQQKLCGLLLQDVLVLIMFPDHLNDAGFGVIHGYLQENNFILLKLQQYAGLFGKLGAKCVLKGNLY